MSVPRNLKTNLSWKTLVKLDFSDKNIFGIFELEPLNHNWFMRAFKPNAFANHTGLFPFPDEIMNLKFRDTVQEINTLFCLDLTHIVGGVFKSENDL